MKCLAKVRGEKDRKRKEGLGEGQRREGWKEEGRAWRRSEERRIERGRKGLAKVRGEKDRKRKEGLGEGQRREG